MKKSPAFYFVLLIGPLTFLRVLAAPGPGASNDFGGKRVLIIGIDGVRPDALQAALKSGQAPHLKQLVDHGTVTWNAFAGGPSGTAQEQATISGAGWTSISTGTWIDIHNVKGNETPPYDQPGTPGSYLVSKAPHFAKRLHEKFPLAQVDIISSWGWLETYLVAAQPAEFGYHAKGAGANYAERDADVKQKTLARLASSDPEVLQLHFDQVDGAGHATGFTLENPIYLNALAKVDGLIGEIMAALKARPQSAVEQWNVLVTTDHGGKGKNHGGQSNEERDIFVIASGPAFTSGAVKPDRVGHNTIPPTTFAVLGLPVLPEWHWSEKPFGIDPAPKK